jgi:hypothetical protein
MDDYREIEVPGILKRALIEGLDPVVYAMPLSKAIRSEISTIEAVKKMSIKGAGPYLDNAIKKRKELIALVKKQITYTSKMIPRKAEHLHLRIELEDLAKELYYIDNIRNTA